MNTSATNEQRQRFERLCLLRALYARRGSHDATSVMTLLELASYARAVLTDPYWRADTARSADSTV
ncbi:MAG: hypothetical protein ABIZ57_04985 [Candidatus Limnocylindria bacterium]